MTRGLFAIVVSRELADALESTCAHSAEPVVAARRKEDLEALRAHLSLFPSIRPDIRRKALYLLGRLADAASVGTIRNLLPTMQLHDRIAAVAALGRIGTAEALVAVAEAARDSSADVRRIAANALGRIGTPDALTHLKRIEAVDTVDFVRAQASRVLRARSARD